MTSNTCRTLDLLTINFQRSCSAVMQNRVAGMVVWGIALIIGLLYFHCPFIQPKENFQRFKHLLQAKKERLPKRVNGLGDIYSMKRLSKG